MMVPPKTEVPFYSYALISCLAWYAFFAASKLNSADTPKSNLASFAATSRRAVGGPYCDL